MLNSIHLINFQKHSDLTIDFCNAVNVIYGESGTGKSCIKHAIEFLCTHDTFRGQRKVGTKTTSVTGVFSSGCTVERIISASINRYILTDKDGGTKEFNSVGKDAPEEIKEAIGIYPIKVDKEEIYLNSQSQIALPFLFDKSPSFRMKLFNQLTGNDVLDKLFAQFNKDILHIKRDIREEGERYEKREVELKEKKIQKEKMEAVHIRLKKRVEKIKSLHLKYSKLLEVKDSLEGNIVNKDETQHMLKDIHFPEGTVVKQLKENIDRFEQLNALKTASEKALVGLDKVMTQLSKNNVPEANLDALSAKIKRYDVLKELFVSFDKCSKLCYTVKEDIKKGSIVLSDKTKEYKDLLKEEGVCPICKNQITEECLKEIKL